MRLSGNRLLICYFLLALAAAWKEPALAAQQPSSSVAHGESATVNDSLGELKNEVHELKQLVLQLQQQATESRTEIKHLREELESSRGASPSQVYASSTDEQPGVQSDEHTAQVTQRLDQLEENEQLLTGKVNEQYQTKVESASKYRVRMSGIVLVNLFGNRGSVDNQDVPTIAEEPTAFASTGSIGGTLRQSILGFEVFGPQLLGARTSGNVNLDFGGGFPSVYNGVDSSIVRLRTATLRLDWKNTSVIGGQDQLFISPNAPTSFASLIVPALSYAGNLWVWTPQLRVEHRFALANNGAVTLQSGVLDPLTGEPPYYQWYRLPQAGERSRVPAVAMRIAYSHPLAGHTLTLGASGYYSRQNWGYNRTVDGWAGMADWNLPLDRWFTLSGLFYRGAAIGGLGGGIGRSVIYSGPLVAQSTAIIPLNTVGGWAQLKFQPTPKLEFNAAFGLDNPFAADLRAFSNPVSYGDPTLARNRGSFGNVIYRPRSDLLFSFEYRRLRTFKIYDYSNEASQVNLGMGILF
jgi:hypothetical protein